MSSSDDLLGKPESEPSYALLSLSRVTIGGVRGGVALFGSSIRHNQTVRMRIKRAEKRRTLSHDWYSSTEELIEVEMSPTQFAEAITSMNMGDGVPCTLRYLGRESIPEPTGESKREQFVGEFKEHTDRVARRLDALETFASSLRDKPSVTKKERDDLLSRIQMARQEIAENLPFVAKQFNEQMDKTVHEAKGEIEAFYLHKVLAAGLASLRGNELEAPEPMPLAIESTDNHA